MKIIRCSCENDGGPLPLVTITLSVDPTDRYLADTEILGQLDPRPGWSDEYGALLIFSVRAPTIRSGIGYVVAGLNCG